MVILFYKSSKVFKILSWSLFLGGAALNFSIMWRYDLKVSITTLENYYYFSKVLRAPWTKLMSFGLAMRAAAFYVWYSERYRKMPAQVKAQKHPILNWFSTKKSHVLTFAMCGVGMLLIHLHW